MNQTIREIITHKRFYETIEDSLSLHLSVADKSGLLMHLRKTNHVNFHDLWMDITGYFRDMGYESKMLKELVKNRMQVDSHWAKAFKPSYLQS